MQSAPECQRRRRSEFAWVYNARKEVALKMRFIATLFKCEENLVVACMSIRPDSLLSD